MREVIPGRLWVGNTGEVRNPRCLHDLGICAVVDLAAEEPVVQAPRHMVYCRFPLLDGPGNDTALVRLSVHTTASLIGAGIPTLVACGAGMSRALAVVAAALAVERNSPPDELLLQITREAPHDVSPGLWSSVRQVCVGPGG